MSTHQRGIQTVDSAGEILNLICNSPHALSLSEIAQMMQLPPSSAYKYLVSLLRTELIQRDESSLTYRAGSLSLRLGLAKMRHDLVLLEARAALTKLADKYQVNVFASMWSNVNGPTVVFYKETAGFFHIGFRLGIRLSLHRTTTGRLFAAYMERQSLQPYLVKLDIKEQAALQDPELIKYCMQIREQGYSHLSGTPTPGLSTYAVPVLDEQEKLIMTLSAFHQIDQLDQEKEHSLIADLKRIALQFKEKSHG